MLCVFACDKDRDPDPPARGPAPATPAQTGSEASPSPHDGSATVDPEPIPPPSRSPDEPPPDFGIFKPPHPPPAAETLTVHALAGYPVVAVYSEPDTESERLGWLRIGTRMMVTPKIEGANCRAGFHALPSGGYSCASKGLVVDEKSEPYLRYPPPPPKHDEALPYEYGYIRKWNSPLWWRIPTAEERARAQAERAIREAERNPPEPEPAAVAPGKPASDPSAPPAGAAAPSPAPPDKYAVPVDPKPNPVPPEAPADPAAGAGTQPKSAEPGTEAGDPAAQPAEAGGDPAAPVEEQEPPPPLPLATDHPWLEKGFFLSLGERMREDGQTWFRTARGAFVNAKNLYKFDAKDFQGKALDDGTQFPVAFAMAKETPVYELEDDGKLKVVRKLERRTFVDVEEETEVKGKTYMVTKAGLLVEKAKLRLPDLQPLPEGLKPWEPWIDVSLDKQMLVAYEGSKPVFVTLVSTGKKGTAEEPFETPTGRWRIQSKHVSTTMDGNTASDGNYAIEDVPWAMYFEGSYALHGAFWHRGFGYVRSHGCVNLGPSDAKWLFHWTSPFLPEGWHGVHANDATPGTTVIVRK